MIIGHVAHCNVRRDTQKKKRIGRMTKTTVKGDSDATTSATFATCDDSELSFKDIGELAEDANAQERAVDRVLNLYIRQGMPLEGVFKSSAMKNGIRTALSICRTPAIVVRFKECPTAWARISAENVGRGRFEFFKSAKGAQTEGKLDMSAYATLTKSGVKMDKYALEFAPSQ
jgi:hypothetical protein